MLKVRPETFSWRGAEGESGEGRACSSPLQTGNDNKMSFAEAVPTWLEARNDSDSPVRAQAGAGGFIRNVSVKLTGPGSGNLFHTKPRFPPQNQTAAGELGILSKTQPSTRERENALQVRELFHLLMLQTQSCLVLDLLEPK